MFDFETFSQLCATETQLQDYPLASEIQKRIPIYQADTLLKDKQAALKELDLPPIS